MKKYIFLPVLLLLSLLISGCIAEDISLLYSESAETDNFYIAINKAANTCFVGQYNCTAYSENMEITIPDQYDGKPITKIGGYYGRGVPSPFSISVGDIYMNAGALSEYGGVFQGDISQFQINDDYTVEDVVFLLNIGENISNIEYVVMDNYYPHINEDGSITFYHPTVYINCSPDNEHFYSQDGKLYDKKTDELISDFAYSE